MKVRLSRPPLPPTGETIRGTPPLVVRGYLKAESASIPTSGYNYIFKHKEKKRRRRGSQGLPRHVSSEK